MATIRERIATQLSTIAPSVEEKVVDVMVERETDKRATAIVGALDKLSKMENDLFKLKPDQVSYDDDGKVTSSSYSKVKFEERKKLRDRIGKYNGAINKALEKGDFGDVYNLDKTPDAPKPDRGEGEE